jgi:hypothetical protein
LATPEPIKDWSLTKPEGEADQDRREGRQLWSLRCIPMAEVAIPRNLFADIRRTAASAHNIGGVMCSIAMRSLQTKGDACLDDGNRDVFWLAARRWPAPTPIHKAIGEPRLPKPVGWGSLLRARAAIWGMSVSHEYVITSRRKSL